MELILGLIGVVLVIGLIQEAINAIEWGRFFAFFIFGSIALGVLFSFTAEGVLVIIGAYAVLLEYDLQQNKWLYVTSIYTYSPASEAYIIPSAS